MIRFSAARKRRLTVRKIKSRQPSAALPLIRLEPAETFLHALVAGRNPCLADHIKGEPSRLAIACGNVLRCVILAAMLLPVFQETSYGPAAIGALEGKELLERLLPLGTPKGPWPCGEWKAEDRAHARKRGTSHQMSEVGVASAALLFLSL